MRFHGVETVVEIQEEAQLKETPQAPISPIKDFLTGIGFHIAAMGVALLISFAALYFSDNH